MTRIPWKPALSALGAVLLVVACGTEAETPEKELTAPEASAAQTSETPTDHGEDTGGAESSETEPKVTEETASVPTPEHPGGFTEGPAPTEEALDKFDVPQQGVVPAPNGEMWPLHGSFNMDVLREYFSATLHMTTWNSGCGDLSQVAYMWLREDGYGEGQELGPTCFGEDGGRVDPAALRLIDYVCQGPHTTARTLILPTIAAEGSDGIAAVFTPEHTTADTWECFDFNGEQVQADQTVVETATDR